MKKIFDFKSSNTDNFIMDKILKLIEKKIHNTVVALLLTIVVAVFMIGLSIGFFVMPFISYSSMGLKIVFSALWLLSCVVFIFGMIDQYKIVKNNDKSTVIITSVCLIVFFGVCFVNNNYYHLGDWWQIAVVVAMGLYTALMIYWFIKELIKNPKGTLSALLMGVMFVFGFLCILASSLISLEMNLRKEMLIVGTICIAFPVIALLIAKILKISKAEKVLEYCSLIILCVFLLIGISYVISFINPNIDAYQTFVTLLASFMGGGLTLLGVAWTIRKTDMDRKEDDKKKYRPIVNFYKMKDDDFINGKFWDGSVFKGITDNPFEKSDDKTITYKLYNLICKNTDFSQFYLSGVIINNIIVRSNIKLYVDRSDYFGFDTKTMLYSKNEVKHFSLIIQDMLGNEYKLPTKLEVVGEDEKLITIKDVGFVCDIDAEECDERF